MRRVEELVIINRPQLQPLTPSRWNLIAEPIPESPTVTPEILQVGYRLDGTPQLDKWELDIGTKLVEATTVAGIMKGSPYRHIAVKAHLPSLFEKLEAANPAEAVAKLLVLRAVECSPRILTIEEPPSLREISAMTGVAQGLGNAAIGEALVLAEETIKTHLKHLYRKLGVGNRVGAVIAMFQIGAFRTLET